MDAGYTGQLVIVSPLLSCSTAGQFGSIENKKANNDSIGSVITTPDKYPLPPLPPVTPPWCESAKICPPVPPTGPSHCAVNQSTLGSASINNKNKQESSD